MISRKKLVDFLKQRGLYEEVDRTLVDELYYNYELIREAKKDIKLRGITTPINSEGSLLGQNPSIAIYQNALKSVKDISRKLGLSPRDRKELKVDGEFKDDGF